MGGLGCVLYELITNEYLFDGDSEIETISKIFQMMGTPSLSSLCTHGCTNGVLRKYQSKIPMSCKREWSMKHIAFRDFCDKDESVTDLLNKLLELIPSKRISASNALKHPFLS